MEYVYIKNPSNSLSGLKRNPGWYELISMMHIDQFDPGTNKNRIKLYNRYPGIDADYTYLDPEDVKFIWKDGTLYCESEGAKNKYGYGNSRSMFNIFPEFIVDTDSIPTLIYDDPTKVMNYIKEWVKLKCSSPENLIYPERKAEILDTLDRIVSPKLTDEQKLVYELSKNDILDMIKGGN